MNCVPVDGTVVSEKVCTNIIYWVLFVKLFIFQYSLKFQYNNGIGGIYSLMSVLVKSYNRHISSLIFEFLIEIFVC